MYKVVNVHRGKGPRAEFVYAELQDEQGQLCIAATLEYIINACQNRGYEVVNMTDTKTMLEVANG